MGVIVTPYDNPRALLDRLLWPMLRRAWIKGYHAGRDVDDRRA